MKETKYILISKLDAAKRQLEYAIHLFFRYGDPVVIHTLMAAAYQVLRDLAKKQSIESVMHDEAMRYIKKEKQKEVKKLLSDPENFFKHAEKDSEKLLKFHYLSTEYLIWDACVVYSRLTSESVPLFTLYKMWFYAKNPWIFTDSAVNQKLIEVSSTYDPSNRPEFLSLLPYIESSLFSKK